MVSGTYKGLHYTFGMYCGEVPLDVLSVDTKCVHGERHVLSSIMTAVDNYLKGTSIARDLYVEILVRLSGERQISKALKCKKSEGKVVIIYVGNEERDVPNLKSLDDVPLNEELDAMERRLLI